MFCIGSMRKVEQGNMIAFVKINYNGLTIDNLKLLNDGHYFVAWPSRKINKKGEEIYIETVYPESAEVRQKIETAIVDCYLNNTPLPHKVE